MREWEMGEIKKKIRDQLEGSGNRTLLIKGQPGIGKTFVVQKILEEIKAEKGKQAVITIYQNAMSFASFKDLLNKLIVQILEASNQ